MLMTSMRRHAVLGLPVRGLFCAFLLFFCSMMIPAVNCFVVVPTTTTTTTIAAAAATRTTTNYQQRHHHDDRHHNHHLVVLSAATTATTTATTPNNNQRQVLTFREPTTNVTVVLVGAMHYNPTSIQLAYDTCQHLANRNQLGSVIVEQCDIRWNKTNELVTEKPYLQPIITKFLNNEMRSAANVALTYNRPVILGDQRINITSIAIKETFKLAMIDLCSPINGGWKRFYNNLTLSFQEAIPFDNDNNNNGSSSTISSTTTPYLNVFSFLDAKLWITAPISFLKYPLSFLVRNPITTTLFFITFFLLNNVMVESTTSIDTVLMTMGGGGGEVDVVVAGAEDLTVSLAISILETILFARVLLGPLLADRNQILARNILEQCKVYQIKQQPVTTRMTMTNNNNFGNDNNMNHWFSNIFKRFIKETSSSTTDDKIMMNVDDFEIIYAPEMIQRSISIPSITNKNKNKNSKEEEQEEEKTVVAILGMAHCNGIMKLLKEQRVVV